VSKRQSPAEVLKRFEGVTEVVADSLHFKRKLAIGEDAYTSLKVGRALSTIWDVGGVAATGAGLASSSAVASTFFASSGILARIGIGAATTATPIGWVVAAALVSGGVYYGVTRAIGRYAGSRVEVIPRFINSPIDQLGAALLDMMGTLALKVANMDGLIDPRERAAMRDYFVTEWGYDPTYTDRALALLEEGALSQPLKQTTTAIGRFVRDHPDCNASVFYSELVAMLREIAEADGQLDEREDLAIEAIERALRS
jgi:uncharacterized tellurite resistance protein B-like protein